MIWAILIVLVILASPLIAIGIFFAAIFLFISITLIFSALMFIFTLPLALLFGEVEVNGKKVKRKAKSE